MPRLVSRDCVVPTLLETDRFRVRPLTIHDVVKDYDAVMSSKEHLRATFTWGWPADNMTLEQNLIDLGWHQKEFQLGRSFAYTVVTLDERRVLGCVYIDPCAKVGYDVEVSWWVRADEVATGLEDALGTTLRRWLAEVWPFTRIGYPGHDLSWDAWRTLTERPA